MTTPLFSANARRNTPPPNCCCPLKNTRTRDKKVVVWRLGAVNTCGFSRRQHVQQQSNLRGCALKVEGLLLSVERQFSLNSPLSTLCAASIMPISQWMCYRKLRSACMRLTVRSLFKAVLQHSFSQFLSRTRVIHNKQKSGRDRCHARMVFKKTPNVNQR